jgi:hypothetical protein
MANLYIEARPKGRPEGDRIDDYVVEDQADRPSQLSTPSGRGSTGLKPTGTTR